MRCPRCDANAQEGSTRCSFCGQDLRVLLRIRRVSNTYYNLGLEKAKVRDLSGAIDVLKKSLEFDKTNTQARNLLGLVYYEIGETVSALCQWVLSKYFQPDDNEADYYLVVVRKNQSSLDVINHSINKYNSALAAAKSGSVDLAIIQLKRVASINPHFVRALQLLALLYIETEEYSKAAKVLNRARKIDFNNTTTLRFMQIVGAKAGNSVKEELSEKNISKSDRIDKSRESLKNVTPVGTYREEKRSLMPIIYVIIGLIVGIAICFFLIRPTLLKNGKESGSQISETSEQLNVTGKKLDTATDENAKLKKQVDDLQKQIKSGDTQAQTSAALYEKLLTGLKYYMSGDKVQAALSVGGIKKSDYLNPDAKELYEKIYKISDAEIKKMVQQGRTQINTSFDLAISTFKKVLSVAPDNQEAMVNLARCYQRTKKLKKAKTWYEKALKIGETTEAGKAAKQYLAEVDKALGTKVN